MLLRQITQELFAKYRDGSGERRVSCHLSGRRLRVGDMRREAHSTLKRPDVWTPDNVISFQLSGIKAQMIPAKSAGNKSRVSEKKTRE